MEGDGLGGHRGTEEGCLSVDLHIHNLEGRLVSWFIAVMGYRTCVVV